MPRTWNVPTDGDLQTVINNANYGDTVIVASSYSFNTGAPLLLPNKGTAPNPAGSNANFITIQTSGLASLPATNNTSPSIISNPPTAGRVNPTHAQFMPKISAPATSDLSAIDTAPGAQYYRFIGIEINAAGAGFSVGGGASIRSYLLRIDGTNGGQNAGTSSCGTGIPTKFSDLPNFIQFDRCYIHAFALNQVCLHGVNLWTLNADVCNCYISAFNGQSGDSQGIICIGPGPYNLINNYVEASTENIFFGRGACADGFINNNFPPGCGASGTAQTLVQFNSLIKNDAWRVTSGAAFQQPTQTANYFCKNLFEIKCGKNITVDHNYMAKSFDEFDQRGVATGCNLINYTGWEHIDNITWTNNIIDGCCGGLYFAWTIEGNPSPTGANTITNLKFSNNLILNFNWQAAYGNLYPNDPTQNHFTGLARVFEFAMVGSTAAQNITFDHNTIVPAGVPGSVGPTGTPASPVAQESGPSGPYIVEAYQAGASATAATGISGLTFSNNIFPDQTDGFIWAPNGFSGGFNANDFSSWKTFAPGGVMAGNVAFNNSPAVPPPTNPSTATFMSQYDPAHTNNTAASFSGLGMTTQPLRLPGAGLNGTDINIVLFGNSSFQSYNGTGPAGCDISKLAWTATSVTSTTTVLSASPTIAALGAPVTLTATVAGSGGTPTGSVQFFNGSTNLGTATLSASGVATLTTTALPVGANSITANYQGDSTFAGSASTAITVSVTGAPTITTITFQPGANVQVGQSVTALIAVTD
jgi:hypothetical protein